MSLTLYITRHGERMDHVEPSFAYTSTTPYDPPLTPKGRKQSKRTGAYIHDVHKESVVKDVERQRKVEYLIYASPFSRTVDTAVGIAEGIIDSDKDFPSSSIKIKIEPALAEWHTAAYYASAVPNSIITTRVEELHRDVKNYSFEVDWEYKPIYPELPSYPEGIHEVLKRCGSALKGITTPFIESLQEDKSKDVVLIFVTHGWCFNVIQEACSKQSPWTEAAFCAVSRAKWVQKGSPQDIEIPEITVDNTDEIKVKASRKSEIDVSSPYGKWSVDIASYTGHLKQT